MHHVPPAPARPSVLARALPECLYLLEKLPRERWQGEAIHGTAGVWLAMHQRLRQGQQRLLALAAHWQDGQLDAADFCQQALPLLHAHLNHLHGHHRLEDQHYFPAMRRAEPRMAAGFDLLDADHQRIERQVAELYRHAQQLEHGTAHRTAAGIQPLVTALQDGQSLLQQHLLDEEDLVIPLLALHERRQPGQVQPSIS